MRVTPEGLLVLLPYRRVTFPLWNWEMRMANERTAYERSVLSEIRMLLDFVAGNCALVLADLKVADFDNPGQQLGAAQVLVRLDAIETTLRDPAAGPLGKCDFALLQLVRDAVSRMAKPATGLTVAFTSLVVGGRRGRHSESRATLAEEAYPALVYDAQRLRLSQYVITSLAVIFTIVAIWIATQVALGKAVLNNLDGLRAQQAGITVEKLRLEQALDKQTVEPASKLFAAPANTAAKRVPMKAFSLCDRPQAIAYYIDYFSPSVRVPTQSLSPSARPGETPVDRLKVYTSPEERDVCERDRLLATSIGIVHDELRDYVKDWTSIIGPPFTWPADLRKLPVEIASLLSRTINSARASSVDNAVGRGDQGKGAVMEASVRVAAKGDVEFIIAPLLLVWGNYVLPIIFGFLGALMFADSRPLRQAEGKPAGPARQRAELAATGAGPRNGRLHRPVHELYSPVAGPVGVTASGTASGLASSLTLSASGLAFLAGLASRACSGCCKPWSAASLPATRPSRAGRKRSVQRLGGSWMRWVLQLVKRGPTAGDGASRCWRSADPTTLAISRMWG